VKILISNDDGVYAPALWTLARKLSRNAEVIVVAPDREQSAVGTAVTLRKPLRVQKIAPLFSGIETYCVEGTPSDAVIVALGKLIKDKVDLVVAGINQGSNLGEDVLISGTVGAALAGYLRGYSAIAVSTGKWEDQYVEAAADVVAAITQRFDSVKVSPHILLNVNMPDIPFSEIKGTRVTRLARKSHINTVEENQDGKGTYYTLIRQSLSPDVGDNTDIRAVEQGYVSVTPLYIFPGDRVPPRVVESLCCGIPREIQR
jgi:5'-nucleotidase